MGWLPWDCLGAAFPREGQGQRGAGAGVQGPKPLVLLWETGAVMLVKQRQGTSVLPEVTQWVRGPWPPGPDPPPGPPWVCSLGVIWGKASRPRVSQPSTAP